MKIGVDLQVNWLDDSVAGVVCECGNSIVIGTSGGECEDCGRKYEMEQTTRFFRVRQPTKGKAKK